MKRRVLKGDHNQCPACSEYFNSTHAFDKHRIGAFGVNRRCMTVAEMLDAGMAKNSGDWWITEAMPTEKIPIAAEELAQDAMEGVGR